MNALVAMAVKHPFVPVGMTIASIVLAAAVACYYDVKLYEVKLRRRRRFRILDWIWRFLFFYLLPALLIAGFAAYSFSTLVIIPYYPGSAAVCHLHDPECRARINPEANQLYSMVGLAIAAALALVYLALVVWRRLSNRPISVY